jgi:hypothetical protein
MLRTDIVKTNIVRINIVGSNIVRTIFCTNVGSIKCC